MQDTFSVAYLPTAHADRVHHMLLYGCDEPGGEVGSVYSCMHGQLCRSRQKIMFAWARNAPAFALPPQVGFGIGKAAGFRHLVLQVHYATPLGGDVLDFSGVTMRLSTLPPPFLAAVYLFVGMASPIPADTSTFFMNMSCTYQHPTPIHPFAFRTHTHGLGRLVSAARRDPADSHWDVIGRRNPQWPQRFQDILKKDQIVIRKGDQLAAQCRYDSSQRHSDTFIGATGHDEMCNFYMMYYWSSDDPSPFNGGGGSCAGDALDAFQGHHHYPDQVSQLLPPRLDKESVARQGDITFG